MGNDRNIKVIRGQLRQIAQELLPTALASALATDQYKSLQKEIHGKLQVIQAQVTETLKKLDERSIEMQNFVTRQVANNTPVPTGPTETSNNTTPENA